MLKLLEAARVQRIVKVQIFSGILMAQEHLLWVLRRLIRVLQEVGTEWVQVGVLKQGLCEGCLVGCKLVLLVHVACIIVGLGCEGGVEASKATRPATSLRTECVHIDHVLPIASKFKLITSKLVSMLSIFNDVLILRL